MTPEETQRTDFVPKQKSLGLAILLSVLISGLGQIYLGFVKRGVLILAGGIGYSAAVNFLLGPYLDWLTIALILPFFIWQVYDTYKLYKLRSMV
ncbi:hypothetical protein NTE_00245 [Candidatus Nitrososphaera evergladensis SR1]|uniref:Uncharacterized protein n=1 Tax=Candidatus Nitrososphaera evergladensis SR1 TaxID=1459636 RepID=A0A075MNE4_9ARCH|nr:hypothetical protein NTE_00245 [Candidatus Nitrososphaera evergladensis SR1]